MLYQERLKKWAIVRLLPDAQHEVLKRFRSVSDAEGHLHILQQQMPHAKLMVVFDRPPDEDAADDEVTKS